MKAPDRQPRVWVLPNRNALGLAAVLAGMWYAGSSQANAAAYLLGFVLTGMAAVSALHAWANVRGVRLAAGPFPPAFADGDQLVRVTASAPAGTERCGITVRGVGGGPVLQFAEIGAVTGPSELAVPAARRGCHPGVWVRVASIFPLGFFTARQTVWLPGEHWIYPAPRGDRRLPRALAPTPEARAGQHAAGDDFGGLRAWELGESQRHIDWKAAARGQPLRVKQWTGEAQEVIALAWAALAPLGTEERLSQLARWVVQAEKGDASYALRLPGAVFAPSRGEAHYHACLRALAAFPAGEEAAS